MINPGQIKDEKGRIMRNASIFAPEGNKITWGDFNEGDIKDMKGVFFVLSEHDSYWKVSENVPHIEGNVPSFDLNRHTILIEMEGVKNTLLKNETVAIDPNYLRNKAKGKIIDGKWLPNPVYRSRTIEELNKNLLNYVFAGFENNKKEELDKYNGVGQYCRKNGISIE